MCMNRNDFFHIHEQMTSTYKWKLILINSQEKAVTGIQKRELMEKVGSLQPLVSHLLTVW